MLGAFSLRDPANHVKLVGLQGQSGVAAGTGDNTEVTSAGVDRVVAGGVKYESAVFQFVGKVTLTDTKTVALTVKISESDDNSSWGADETLISAEVLLTGSSSTNAIVIRELGLDLSSRKRYVRFKITVDLNAAGTDVFVYGAGLMLIGADRLPV